MPHSGWLSTVLIGARAVMLPAMAFAVVVALMVAMSRRRRRPLPARQPGIGQAADAALQSRPGTTALTAGMVDVEAEARLALEKVSGLAAPRSVKLEIAVPVGLTASLDQHVFREVLHGLLVHAISESAPGRVLLGAYQSGGALHVSVTDNGTRSALATQQELLRPTERLAAVLEATLGIEVWPGQGTSMVLRLPITGTASRITPAIGAATARLPEAMPHPVRATTR